MGSSHSVQDYRWVIYVDASGDDGFAFDRGSSETYTVNCFICKTDEIGYNQDILRKIKAIVRCDPNTEMKSGTVIRSKRRAEICDALSQLHGGVFQYVVFKRMIDIDSITEEQKRKHHFSTLIQSGTITLAASLHKHLHESVCIIVDNMKAEEVLGTREYVADKLKGVEYKMIFADSKSAEHSLLQIADYFAGLTNRACTNHEAEIRSNPSINRCMNCRPEHSLCRFNPLSIQTPLFSDIHRYVKLFVAWINKRNGTVIGNGIRMFPETFQVRYRFFDCVTKKYFNST